MAPPAAPDHLALALRAAGFRCLTRREGWWECLLLDGESSWHGRGESEAEAVRAALAAMVPSGRARALLIEALATRNLHAAVAETVLEPVLEPVVEPMPELVVESVHELAAGIATEAPAAPAEEPPPPAAPSPPPRAPRVAPSAEEVQRALADVAELRECIVAAAPELGAESPRRIRLNILGWIAAARAFQESYSGQRKIEDAVYDIAQRLQAIARRLWPGSVPALQLHQTPRGCCEMLHLPAEAEPPKTWRELAACVGEELATQEARTDRDEDGWADGSALEPPPRVPDALLREVRGRVEKLTGPLGDDARIEPGLRPERNEALRAELLDLARKLRWLRGTTADAGAWGDVAGRLRAVADRHERALPELGQILASSYHPGSSWARLLGQDPASKAQRLRRREVFAARPRAGASAAEIRAWLLEAFEHLENPAIAVLVEEVAAEVLALDPAQLPDSRHRRRLRHLLERLREAPADAANAERIREEAAAAEGIAEGVAEPAAARAVPDPRLELRERARAYTRGRRLLFVSNRKDPQLEQRLNEALQPALLDWCDGKASQIDAKAKRLQGGGYDVVIMATGFLSHSGENKLREACGRATAYVRAFKGRELACLRAVVRDMG